MIWTKSSGAAGISVSISFSQTLCEWALATCLILQEKWISKAESGAAGCKNICHNYPDNINITAPGSAELPGPFLLCVLVCNLLRVVLQYPVLRSRYVRPKTSGGLFSLFLGPHTKLGNCFSIMRGQHHIPVRVVYVHDKNETDFFVSERLLFQVWSQSFWLWIVVSAHVDSNVIIQCSYQCSWWSVPKVDWSFLWMPDWQNNWLCRWYACLSKTTVFHL